MSYTPTSGVSDRTASLTLWLLGRFCIQDNTPPALLHSPRLQSLLAYLVLHCHEPRSRSQVAFALWPDSSDAQAHANLRRALYRLRHAWPTSAQLVQTTPTTLHWTDNATLTIDVRQFLDGVAQASTPEALAAALAWYHGPLLPGCTDDWLVADRERFWQYWLDGLMRLSELHEAAQQYDQAILVAEQVCQHAPLNERHYQRLMRLHLHVGNQNAALHTYRSCLEMLTREYGTTPSAETMALGEAFSVAFEERAFASDLLVRLPVQPTPFVGRTAELYAVHQLLDQPACRLLTVLGPGGVGKTRLALQAAAQRRLRYLHGVVFVSLAAVRTTDDLLLELIGVLRLAPQGQASMWDTLVTYLRPRRVLLLLDAFEHVLDAATLLGDLLAVAPGLSLLVTSREALRVQWEQRFPLDGLKLPSGDAITPDKDLPDAVALFYERARRVQPQFTLTPQDATAVTTICQTVGGLPLGIEIAAAWIAQMDCTAIADTMRRQCLTTENTLRDATPVQRSLYATTVASWQRLSPAEQRSYRRLAPFRGHFSAAAANAVAVADPTHLQRFVDTSLLWQVAPNRYQFHEVLREFAAAQLDDPVEWMEAHAAHSAYYLDLLHQQEPRLHGSANRQGLDTIQTHYSDIRTAWQWALEHQQWDTLLCGIQALGDFYESRAWIQVGYTHMHETQTILEAAIHACNIPIETLWKLSARVAYRVAWFSLYRGEFETARSLLESGIQRAETVRADWEIALTRYFMGHVLVWRGQIAAAQPHLASAWATFVAQGDIWYLQHMAETYGEIALLEQDYARAQHRYRQALAYAEALEADTLQSTDLLLLGRALFLDGKIEEAHHTFRQSLALARAYDDNLVAASCLVGLGWVSVLQERRDAAWSFFHEGIRLAQSIAVPLVVLHAAIGIAHLLVGADDILPAIELLRLVLSHPACDEEPRMRAQALLDELMAVRSPEQQDALHTTLPAPTLEAALDDIFRALPLDDACSE